MEKPSKITCHLEALTSYEAEISELACSTEDMVHSKSRKSFLAKSTEKRSIALWELFFLNVGIGKTTSATKIYEDAFIMSRFDIRAKTTVSQEYCARNVLLSLLSSIRGETGEFYKQDDGQLADRLQKLLKGGRYLVVIDDIWITETWDDIKVCFLECNNGSRILLTIRNTEVVAYASSGKPPYHMRLLNFDKSWDLLYEKVFVQECFPPEFEQLGRQIALKCGGLPLVIVVIAGLLSKIGKALAE
ncbi:hypothetical protein RND71_008125 [Anisodus tanguticus]|uniref:NB-ARC domain-containing protein n=1 Tax=Anisodus tanguticus TaxID=243964 RepID=A0AAE1SQ88_9SOLA|nr:hypothetical protein RND71_008125 [Anisodus tanguticus]